MDVNVAVSLADGLEDGKGELGFVTYLMSWDDDGDAPCDADYDGRDGWLEVLGLSHHAAGFLTSVLCLSVCVYVNESLCVWCGLA